MAKQVTMTRVQASANQAQALDAAVVSNRLVEAFLGGEASIKNASDLLAQAKVGKLATVKAALQGVEPLTAELWDTGYHAPAKLLLEQSGKYSTKMSLGAAMSDLKLAAIALTQGIAIKEGDGFKSYCNHARDALARKGLWAKTGKGSGTKASTKAKLAAQGASKVQGVSGKANASPGADVTSAADLGLSEQETKLMFWAVQNAKEGLFRWINEQVIAMAFAPKAAAQVQAPVQEAA